MNWLKGMGVIGVPFAIHLEGMRVRMVTVGWSDGFRSLTTRFLLLLFHYNYRAPEIDRSRFGGGRVARASGLRICLQLEAIWIVVRDKSRQRCRCCSRHFAQGMKSIADNTKLLFVSQLPAGKLPERCQACWLSDRHFFNLRC
jgi:hypothetical protein